MTYSNHNDTLEARCNGLKSGYAICERTGKKAYSAYVTKKDGPFYCPKCSSTAIVRKCSEKEDHFAHKPRLSPVLTQKDQSMHTECKNALCNYLSKQYPNGNWAVERAINESKRFGTKKIVPDISGRINGIPIAIEVQRSAYTLNKIKEKTEIYNKRGVYVLWIIPLREELGDDDFRPRLYEKYLHAMYFGRAYYWIPTKPNRLLPVHFSYSCRYISPSSFYDEDGEEKSFGGFYLAYKTIKKPNSIGYIDIATELKKVERPFYINKKWEEEIPACKIMMDTKEIWWSRNEKEEMIDSMENSPNQNDEFNSEDMYDSYDYYESESDFC